MAKKQHEIDGSILPRINTLDAPCHKAQIMSNWVLEHDNGFTVLQRLPPDINPLEHLCDVLESDKVAQTV